MKKSNHFLIYLFTFYFFACGQQHETSKFEKRIINSVETKTFVDTLVVNELRRAEFPIMAYIKGGDYSGIVPVRRTENGEKTTSDFPQIRVHVSDFEMSKTEVTVRQFAYFVKATGYRTCPEKYKMRYIIPFLDVNDQNSKLNWRHSSTGELLHTDNYDEPVRWITKYDAQKYCAWLSQNSIYDYDLPSLFQFYTALLGTNNGSIDSANILDYAVLDTCKSFQKLLNNQFKILSNPSKVASKKPNKFGFFDLLGNISEYVKDETRFTYSDSAKVYSDTIALCEQEFKPCDIMTFGFSFWHPVYVFERKSQSLTFSIGLYLDEKSPNPETYAIAGFYGFRVVRRSKNVSKNGLKNIGQKGGQ